MSAPKKLATRHLLVKVQVQLAEAKNGLEDAQIALCGAVTEHAETKRTLEREEAHLICKGVEGKNERERSATLLLELTGEYAALHAAEDALAEARCAYELAKLEWDLARYQLRAVEKDHLLEVAS